MESSNFSSSVCWKEATFASRVGASHDKDCTKDLCILMSSDNKNSSISDSGSFFTDRLNTVMDRQSLFIKLSNRKGVAGETIPIKNEFKF